MMRALYTFHEYHSKDKFVKLCVPIPKKVNDHLNIYIYLLHLNSVSLPSVLQLDVYTDSQSHKQAWDKMHVLSFSIN